MFGLFVLALVVAMFAGLSDDESMSRQTIVEAKPNTSDLLSDLKDY